MSRVEEAVGMAQGRFNGLRELGFVNDRRKEELVAAIAKSVDDACKEVGIELGSEEYDEVLEKMQRQNQG